MVPDRQYITRTPENFIGVVRAGHLEKCRGFLAGGKAFLEGHWYADAALNDAAQYGDIELVRLLLDAGFPPNVIGRPGFTPLHMAQSYGHIDIVKLLLEAGASPSFATEACRADWLTALQSAVVSGREQAVILYVELCGEDLAQRTKNGRTLLQLAAQSPGMTALLYSLKTDVMIQNAVEEPEGATFHARPARTLAHDPL